MFNYMLLLKFWLLMLCGILGYTFGWFFTEEYRLADKHPLFRFKGFECRACLSFHITWVLAVSAALCFSDWIMLMVGVFFAFMIHIGLRLDEKEKTIKI